jgi:phosphinothricin acetyltransferase
MTGYHLRDAEPSDKDALLQIFNYYAVNTFAAYPSGPVPPAFMDHVTDGAIAFRVCEAGGDVCGFSLMKPFLPFQTCRQTATVTYFLSPPHTGKGVGSLLLSDLITIARKQGIRTLLANIASKNEASLRFHEKNGFTPCGRFHDAGIKFGEPFDIVWFERHIPEKNN